MKNPLSYNEFRILQLLWKENRSLSRPEIIELTPEKNWNPNSIHLILNNMIEKGAIKVDGMARCGRGYGRTYAAAISNSDYAVDQLIDATPDYTPDQRLAETVRILMARGGITEEGRAALQQMLNGK